MPKMTGHRYLAEAMRGYNVTHLFYVNSVVGQAMLEMDKVGVKRVVAHGEKAAAYMADGYARACLRPGICLSQDIGTTNLLAGMRDAHMGSIPVIAITGGQGDQPRYRHAYQNAEDFKAWDSVTKANYCVDTVQRLPDLLRQAFRDATTGTPGPVHLELRGNAGQMLDREADFDGVFEERFSRFPAFRFAAEPAAVQAAVKALRTAGKPIIVAGGGAAVSDAGPELLQLAEKLSIPIATGLHARALVPDDHPLAVGVPGSYSRWCANKAIAAADLVFYVGSHTGGQVTNAWQVPKIGTPVIQLDIDAAELGRNYPNAVSLHGDAKLTLGQLVEAAGKEPARRAEWLEQVRGSVAEYWAECEPLRNSEAMPLRPERICKELEQWLPPQAVLVADTFHAALWTAQMLRLTKSGQRYIRCAGSLGWAFPATIGVKAALPDRPVIGFTGDAGFYYHMAEMETAARCGINLVMIVNNNHSGGVSETARFHADVDFAQVAHAMGCWGIRVERAQDIQPALEKALGAGKPAIVEILSDPAIRAQRGWVPES
jgi:acetolactate synthase-1/2/3 large subunit